MLLDRLSLVHVCVLEEQLVGVGTELIAHAHRHPTSTFSDGAGNLSESLHTLLSIPQKLGECRWVHSCHFFTRMFTLSAPDGQVTPMLLCPRCYNEVFDRESWSKLLGRHPDTKLPDHSERCLFRRRIFLHDTGVGWEKLARREGSDTATQNTNQGFATLAGLRKLRLLLYPAKA